MFLQISKLNSDTTQLDILTMHPQKLADRLEEEWTRVAYSDAEKVRLRYQEFVKDAPDDSEPTFDWQHIIYAFMLENTRMAQIFHKMLQMYRNGEALGTASKDTQLWLRNTEILFFRHLPGFYTYSLRSEIRPDAEAMRRNAYYRMFGIELGHGDIHNNAYPFVKPALANKGFTTTITRLLAEIHQAIINQTNTSGTNTRDFASIASLSKSLGNMLQERRHQGTLSQEEFNAVAMMSWFHFTLMKTGEDEFQLFKDLGITANSPEDRLIKIGQKVGLAANTKSGSLIELASDLSDWLLNIEKGQFDKIPDVEAALGSIEFRQLMTRIITNWSNATGAQIKRPGVAVLN